MFNLFLKIPSKNKKILIFTLRRKVQQNLIKKSKYFSNIKNVCYRDVIRFGQLLPFGTEVTGLRTFFFLLCLFL